MTGLNGPGYRSPDAAALAVAAEPFVPPAAAPPVPALIQRMWWDWMKPWPGQAPHELLFLFLRLDGVGAEAAEAAVKALVARHDTLRSRFREEAAGLAMALNDADDFAVDVVGLDQAGGPELEAAMVAEQMRFAAEPMRIGDAWLSKARIVAAPSGALLCLAFHHMVFDARSRVLVEHELRARLDGTWSDPPRPPQYPAYAAWEAAWLARGEGLVDYWRGWLAQAPPLRNPAGGTLAWRPSHKVYWEFELTGEPVARLKATAAGSTPFRTLLAATGLAAGRWAGQPRVVVRGVGDLRTSRPLQEMVGNLVCTDLVVLGAPAAPDAAALVEAAGAAYREAVRRRCPNLLGLPSAAGYPDVSEDGIGSKTAVTLNYMPLYRLRGGEPPAPGALGAFAPPVPTLSEHRAYWPVAVCPINLRIWDWGERLVCRMEFDDDAIPRHEQARLNELFIAAVHDLPKGLVA